MKNQTFKQRIEQLEIDLVVERKEKGDAKTNSHQIGIVALIEALTLLIIVIAKVTS